MIGASTTNMKLDRDVWLWCSKNGNAVWYAMCCQNVARADAAAPQDAARLHDPHGQRQLQRQQLDVRRAGCQPNKIRCLQAGGFCSKAGQMVGASTTKDNPDGKVWLRCTAAPAPRCVVRRLLPAVKS